MKIIIKATNTTLTPSIKEYVEEKIGGLDRFLAHLDPGLIEARVEIGRIDRDQRQGAVFRAEVNLYTGRELLRSESRQENLHAAIDVVRDELAREIKKTKEKDSDMTRRGERSWKKFWHMTPLARKRGSKVEDIIE